jgi:hypothetical protein
MYRVRKGSSTVAAAGIASGVVPLPSPAAPLAGTQSVAAPSPTMQLVIDRQSILDFIACPKKFYNIRALPILQPPTLLKPDPRRNAYRSLSISQVVRLQDSVEFRELCYMWDRNTTSSKAVLVRESDFEQAHVKTTEIVNQYFDTTHKKLGNGAPPLTIHRPAIRSLYAVPSSNSSSASRIIELRSRPSILHFYPKTKEWRMYSPSAVTDPLSDKFRAEWLLQSMLFDMCVLKGWQGTTPLLSSNAKEYLKNWSFDARRSSSTTPSSSTLNEVTMRSDKSGVLSIRPYISGPLTLQHHDTYTLSQFVLKTVQSEIAKRVSTSGKKSSSAEGADQSEAWDLDAGMASMMLHIRNASEILTGAIDERRRKLWSAMSRNDKSSVEHKNDPAYEPPYAALISSICKKETVDCPLYSAGNCLPMSEPAAPDRKIKAATVFDMPGFSIDKKSALWAANVRSLKDIAVAKASPSSPTVPAVKLSPSQSRFLDAHVQDYVSVNPKEIQRWFSSLQYPVFMLDFEAVQFALPPFEQSKPYQAIPFQFSLDVFHEDVLTETPTHYEFLYIEEPNCNTFADPRSICISKLMNAIRKERDIAKHNMQGAVSASTQNDDEERLKRGKAKDITEGKMIKGLYSSENRKLSVQPWEGTIVAHYATYEKSVLQKASLLLPQFRDEIINMLFLDTIDLARGGLVHPATNGSTSLKKLVPALLSKEDQYQSFSNVVGSSDDGDSQDSAADGSSAAALYRLWRQKGAADLTLVKELQDAKAEAERLGWSKVRAQLLQYCNADTRNMYLVVRAIHKLMENSIARGDLYDQEGWSVPCVGNNASSDVSSPKLSVKAERKPAVSRAKKSAGAPDVQIASSTAVKRRGRVPKK